MDILSSEWLISDILLYLRSYSINESIISDKAWLSDALSTACYSMKKDSLKEICDRFKAEAIFFEKGIFKKLS